MMPLDVEAVRAEVRALDYARGTPDEAADWRRADADARHNNVIEGLEFSPVEDALFDMLRDEAVPPSWRRRSFSDCTIIPTPIGASRSHLLERAGNAARSRRSGRC